MVVLIVFACINILVSLIIMAVAAGCYVDNKNRQERNRHKDLSEEIKVNIWWMKFGAVMLVLSVLSYYLYILLFVYGSYRLIKFCYEAYRAENPKEVKTKKQD